MRREEVRVAEALSVTSRDPRIAVRRALDLLARASEDWRGNGTAEVGSLHWPVALNLARRELARALEALEYRQITEVIAERRAFQAGGPQP